MTWTALLEESLTGMLGLCLVLAVPLALLVLVLYKRSVLKLMNVCSPPMCEEPQPLPVHTDGSGYPLDSHRRDSNDPSPETVREAATLRRRAVQKSLNLAVGTYAMLAAVVVTISPDELGDWQTRTPGEWVANAFLYLLFVFCLCAPMTLLGVASTRIAHLFWTRLAPLYGIILGIALIPEDGLSLEDFFIGILIMLVIFAGLGARRMRNVVPLLTILLFPVISVLYVFGVGMTLWDPCFDQEILWLPVVELGSLSLALWGAVRATGTMVGWLTRAYERKQFSDAQFQVGSWMVVITLLLLLAPGYEEEGWNPWSLGVLAAMLAGLWLYRFLLCRVDPWGNPRRLLLLRVFAHDKRGEKLLDQVAFDWRFIGPINMISGPDLAASTLEPHELFLFLRRRLRELFLTSPTLLPERMARLDERPDPDARFRINELFCFDNVWLQVVDQMVGRADAVLLDLRGFNISRRGTTFELELLARRGMLERTVFLVNRETDLMAVEEVMRRIPGASIPEGMLWRADEAVDGAGLFMALLSRSG